MLGLYIIARMIIEDGRLERELLHGGQPDDEEPERAPAMFRDPDTTRGTGTATTMPWRACNLQICRSAPARGKHKRKAAAGNHGTGRIAGAAHCDGTPARRVTLWGRRPPP